MDDLGGLIAFLNARLDEDERVARGAERYWHGVRIESATTAEEDHARRHDPARVLREVEAKRRILAEYDTAFEQAKKLRGGPHGIEAAVRLITVLGIVRSLAPPYSDHPDFREDWRP